MRDKLQRMPFYFFNDQYILFWPSFIKKLRARQHSLVWTQIYCIVLLIPIILTGATLS